MFPWSFGTLSTRTSMNKSTSNRPSPSCSSPRRSTAEPRPCWPGRRGPRPITPPCCSSSSRKVSLQRSWMQTSPRRTSAASPSRRWVCRLVCQEVWSVVRASNLLKDSNSTTTAKCRYAGVSSETLSRAKWRKVGQQETTWSFIVSVLVAVRTEQRREERKNLKGTKEEEKDGWWGIVGKKEGNSCI